MRILPMQVIRRVSAMFENWIDPFRPVDMLRPPQGAWQFLWHYVSQAKLPFVAAMLAGGLSALVEAAFFFYIGQLVDILDNAGRGNGWAGLLADHGTEIAIMVGVVIVGRVLVLVFQSLIDEQTLSRGFYNLVRWQAYQHVARQSINFFNNEFAGRVVTKVWQSGAAVGDFMSGMLQVVWSIGIFTFTTLALFAQLDWRLAAIVAVWVAIFAVLARYFVPRMRELSAKNAEASSSLNGRLVDSYANIQTLKLFGRSDENDQYVREGYDRFMAATTRFGRAIIGVRSSMALLSGIMMAAIGYVCIELWLAGSITVGAVAFALGLITRLNMMLGRLMGQINGLMRNFGVVQNSMEMISKPIELEDAPRARSWFPTKGHIRFENVSFNYAGGSDVIQDFGLDIAPGEKIGLVGASGAGKSTLVSLLLRFYDLDSGRIAIDGQDISLVRQDDLRAAVGVVTQDTSLLHRSIRENIMYGRPDATEEEMIAAAKKAEAHDFIVGLKDHRGRTGYSAEVGERGIKLSGGQRQRIAIARVLLKDAPILVLDEATSALDSEVEAAIQGQLAHLMEGKTVIAIAHRLSTIAAMDRLIVLDQGRIVEQGRHDDLLVLQGHYARLWSRQSGGFLNADETAGAAR